MNLCLPGWLQWHAGFSNSRVKSVPRLRWSALRCACEAVRDRRFGDARNLLTQEGDLDPTDAPCLNLLGVLAMARGNWVEAARLWRLSINADGGYRPARRNMRRYFELFQFGRSHIPIALGDEPESFLGTGVGS